jgi:hypothetical protein
MHPNCQWSVLHQLRFDFPLLALHVCADLKVLGGLEPLVSLLADDQAPSLQAGAAHVLGTAVSNNEKLADVLVKEYPKLLQQLVQVCTVLLSITGTFCAATQYNLHAAHTQDLCRAAHIQLSFRRLAKRTQLHHRSLAFSAVH